MTAQEVRPGSVDVGHDCYREPDFAALRVGIEAVRISSVDEIEDTKLRLAAELSVISRRLDELAQLVGKPARLEGFASGEFTSAASGLYSIIQRVAENQAQIARSIPPPSDPPVSAIECFEDTPSTVHLRRSDLIQLRNKHRDDAAIARREAVRWRRAMWIAAVPVLVCMVEGLRDIVPMIVRMIGRVP